MIIENKTEMAQVPISVHTYMPWCGDHCRFLSTAEPRCTLHDDGPLKTIKDRATIHFIRCNECLGKTR